MGRLIRRARASERALVVVRANVGKEALGLIGGRGDGPDRAHRSHPANQHAAAETAGGQQHERAAAEAHVQQRSALLRRFVVHGRSVLERGG